ncbi:YeeE/YedE family protein (DUF395) [Thiovulum sp. ES]|nr:YeeE/YedE family protein (DUF395) [Thiovulum sp. ES]
MIETISEILQSVANQDHGSIAMVFIIGLFFGVVVQWSRVDTFEKIAGFSMLKDFTMIKLVLFAMGIITIGLYFMVGNDLAHYSPKPIYIGALIIGGTLFGIGMSIFGKCPGTGTISLAEGRLDVLVGILGGLLGGAVYTIFYMDFKFLLGENLGKIQLLDFIEGDVSSFVIGFGVILIILSFVIPDREIHYDKE